MKVLLLKNLFLRHLSWYLHEKRRSIRQKGNSLRNAIGEKKPPTHTPVESKTVRRVLAASFAGTAIEYFDFYLYGIAAALVFGPAFFPASAPGVQQLQALATFALAYFVRPLGAVLFGHFGDRVGRKKTLVASLVIMGASTVLIGCLPTYDSVGWAAPVALCLLRCGQGIGFGGEWGGAVLLAVENAPAERRAWYGTFPQLGPAVGILAANLCLFALTLGLTPSAFLAWGWRLPFLFSALLVGLGLYVRLSLAETAAFTALAASEHERVPLAAVIAKHGRAILAGSFASAMIPILAYVFGVFAVDYGTRVLGYARSTLLLLECVAAAFHVMGLLLSGLAANRLGPRPVLLVALAACAFLSVLPGLMLGEGTWPSALGLLCLGFLVLGWVAAPMGTALAEMFPTQVRYTGTSVALNLAGVLGGASAPYMTQTLASAHGIAAVGFYLGGAALLGFLAVLAMGRAEGGR